MRVFCGDKPVRVRSGPWQTTYMCAPGSRGAHAGYLQSRGPHLPLVLAVSGPERGRVALSYQPRRGNYCPSDAAHGGRARLREAYGWRRL